jgi:uncharacterized protein YndB with AHSA1/START domain
MSEPKHVYEVFIQASPDRVWKALTDGALTERYFHRTRVESTWLPGAPLTYLNRDGSVGLEGEIVEADPPRRIVHTFHFPEDPDEPIERRSRVTWELEPRGPATLLRLTHDDFDGETKTYRGVEDGWVSVLSGLKTLLETGKAIDMPSAEAVEATA